jgi:hypothetical protein
LSCSVGGRNKEMDRWLHTEGRTPTSRGSNEGRLHTCDVRARKQRETLLRVTEALHPSPFANS